MMLRSCLCINIYIYIYSYIYSLWCDHGILWHDFVLDPQWKRNIRLWMAGNTPKMARTFRFANSYDSFRTLQKPWQIQEVFIGPVTQLVEKDQPVWGGTWPILPNLCKWGIASRRLARGGPWPPWGFSKMFEPRGPKDHPKPILITSLRMSVSPIFNKIIK